MTFSVAHQWIKDEGGRGLVGRGAGDGKVGAGAAGSGSRPSAGAATRESQVAAEAGRPSARYVHLRPPRRPFDSTSVVTVENDEHYWKRQRV